MKASAICTALIASAFAFGLSGCDSSDDSSAVGTSQSSPDRATSTPAADNTGRNRDDGERDAQTPMDQSQASEHIKLTAEIRRAVMDEESLSFNAKNCKIITDRSGRVWLRGVVDTHGEKDLIEDIARRIAGATIVTSELEVKAG